MSFSGRRVSILRPTGNRLSTTGKDLSQNGGLTIPYPSSLA